MLKNISSIVSPELLKVLCEMGHSDTIVIADGNFPVESMGKDAKVIRLDGHAIPPVLDAILQLIPLDTYIEKPVKLMEVVPGDQVKTPIWEEYKNIIWKYSQRQEQVVGTVERFEFYEQAKKAYAIVATSEKALYANIILQKGVI